MAEAAVLNDDVGVCAVVGIRIGPGAFAALDGDEVVSCGKAAAADDHVAAGIYVYAVRARGLDRLDRSEDIDILKLNVLALVQVYVPECGVAQPHPFHGHVAGIADTHEARAADFQIGAGRILLPAGPERIPAGGAAAVQGAAAADGETITAVGVYKRSRIGLKYALDVDRDVRIIGSIRASLEHGALLQPQARPGLEEQRPAAECPLRNHHGAAPLCRSVYRLLDCHGLYHRTVPDSTVIQNIVLPPFRKRNSRGKAQNGN